MLRTAHAARHPRPGGGDDRRHCAGQRGLRRNVGFYYDLVKANVERIVKGLTAELEDHPVTAVGVTPGWLRSEGVLGNFRRHRGQLARRVRQGSRDLRCRPRLCRQEGVAALAQAGDASRWAGTIVLSARQLADAYSVTDTDGTPRLLGLSGRLLGPPRRRRHRPSGSNVAYPAAVGRGNRGACIGEDERGSPARPRCPPPTRPARNQGHQAVEHGAESPVRRDMNSTPNRCRTNALTAAACALGLGQRSWRSVT